MVTTRAPGVAGVAALCAVLVGSSIGAQQRSAAERLGALEAELATLEHDAQILEDTKAIKRLQNSYGYYVDKKLSREIGALFADAPITTAELGGLGVYVGKARIAEFYDKIIGGAGLKEGQLFNHMILQGVVHVAPNGLTAKGRYRALIQIGEHGKSATWAEGPYENEYVKENGVWKIRSLHWFANFIAPYEGGWLNADAKAIDSYAMGRGVTPDRPSTISYEPYPGVFTPPFHYSNPVTGQTGARQ